LTKGPDGLKTPVSIEKCGMTAITLIDNYDSFTWNLVHCLGSLGADVSVHRNDEVTVSSVLASPPDAIVLSPGPCRPSDAGICLELVKTAAAIVPIFGVCLGHQALGEAFGGKVVRAPQPVHGKSASIHHSGEAIFRGIEGPFDAVRYHSLVVQGDTIPDALGITATTDDLVMGLSHKSLPAHGVQFHPESIASEHGLRILENFLELAAQWNAESRHKGH
jgi:anthranilate synthase component 2